MLKRTLILLLALAATGCRTALGTPGARASGSGPGSTVLNLEIEGSGYFAVQDGESTAYTRCGSIDEAAGGLLAIHGNPLSPQVSVPAGSTGLAVSAAGLVTAQEGATSSNSIGSIDIFLFLNPGNLHALGGGLYEPTGNEVPLQTSPGDKASGAGLLVATDSAC